MRTRQADACSRRVEVEAQWTSVDYRGLEGGAGQESGVVILQVGGETLCCKFIFSPLHTLLSHISAFESSYLCNSIRQQDVLLFMCDLAVTIFPHSYTPYINQEGGNTSNTLLYFFN